MHLSAVLKFIRGARGYYVPFFFWLSRKNGRATEKNYSGGKIFRAYSRLPSQKFVSPYAYGSIKWSMVYGHRYSGEGKVV